MKVRSLILSFAALALLSVSACSLFAPKSEGSAASPVSIAPETRISGSVAPNGSSYYRVAQENLNSFTMLSETALQIDIFFFDDLLKIDTDDALYRKSGGGAVRIGFSGPSIVDGNSGTIYFRVDDLEGEGCEYTMDIE